MPFPPCWGLLCCLFCSLLNPPLNRTPSLYTDTAWGYHCPQQQQELLLEAPLCDWMGIRSLLYKTQVFGYFWIFFNAKNNLSAHIHSFQRALGLGVSHIPCAGVGIGYSGQDLPVLLSTCGCMWGFTFATPFSVGSPCPSLTACPPGEKEANESVGRGRLSPPEWGPPVIHQHQLCVAGLSGAD